jgi:hypothetical protein
VDDVVIKTRSHDELISNLEVCLRHTTWETTRFHHQLPRN